LEWIREKLEGLKKLQDEHGIDYTGLGAIPGFMRIFPHQVPEFARCHDVVDDQVTPDDQRSRLARLNVEKYLKFLTARQEAFPKP
jgi:hypothetical protein